MDPNTKTLHFRCHPRFTAGMVLRNQTLITSGLPFRIEQEGWLVRSISFQGKPRLHADGQLCGGTRTRTPAMIKVSALEPAERPHLDDDQHRRTCRADPARTSCSTRCCNASCPHWLRSTVKTPRKRRAS